MASGDPKGNRQGKTGTHQIQQPGGRHQQEKQPLLLLGQGGDGLVPW